MQRSHSQIRTPQNSNNRELTDKCLFGDKMHNGTCQYGGWVLGIGDWGLGNKMKLVEIS